MKQAALNLKKNVGVVSVITLCSFVNIDSISAQENKH